MMKLLTKNSDYAIRALLVLARDTKAFISARQIAKEQNIPYQFLRRILQELIRNKLVISREGSGGGVRINKSPKRIKASEIIKIFQGDICISECMFRRDICQNRMKCTLRKQIQRIERIVREEFTGITILSLLKK